MKFKITIKFKKTYLAPMIIETESIGIMTDRFVAKDYITESTKIVWAKFDDIESLTIEPIEVL